MMEAYCHTCLKYQEMINPKEFSLDKIHLIMLWEFMGTNSDEFIKNKEFQWNMLKNKTGTEDSQKDSPVRLSQSSRVV